VIRALDRLDSTELLILMRPYLAEVAPDIPISADSFVTQTWSDHRYAYGLFAPDLGGFALIRRVAAGAFQMSEFFILPDLRNRGHGTRLAHHALTRHPGDWVLGIAPAGPGPDFWPVCLAACPDVVHIRTGPPLLPQQRGSLQFTVKEPAP
jgi:GNAT superfamily N-acetyltransferase